MIKIVLIFCAGGVGAVLRFGASAALGALTRPETSTPTPREDAALALFPTGTFAVNVIGCLLIGVLVPLLHGVREEVRLMLIVGLLGGFTTFSAFGHETVSLLEQGRAGVAAAYVALSVGAGVGAVFLGHAIAGWVGG